MKILIILVLLLYTLYFISIEYNANKLNNYIVEYLESSKPIYNNQYVNIDYLTPKLAKLIIDSNRQIVTHHSYSYKNTENTTIHPIINTLYKIPIITTFIDNLSKTQSLTLYEQAQLGVSVFDIRISKFNNELVIDHGAIFGTLKEFNNDFIEATTAIGEGTKFPSEAASLERGPLGRRTGRVYVKYSISKNNTEPLTTNEIDDYLRTIVPKEYINYYIHKSNLDKGIYLNTLSISEIIRLVENNDYSSFIELILTNKTKHIIAHILVIFIVYHILVYISQKK